MQQGACKKADILVNLSHFVELSNSKAEVFLDRHLRVSISVGGFCYSRCVIFMSLNRISRVSLLLVLLHLSLNESV